MPKNEQVFHLAPLQAEIIKEKMLNWVQQFSIFLYLDNNNFSNLYNRFECLLALGGVFKISGNSGNLLEKLYQVHTIKKDWLFGHICYDYKNSLEPKLTSQQPHKLGFPILQFFIPETICIINIDKTELIIETDDDPNKIYDELLSIKEGFDEEVPSIKFKKAIEKEKYLNIIDLLRSHIAEGDCYEINFCNESICENIIINPYNVFRRLNKISPAPFAAFYRVEEKYVICSSPERYLFKQDSKIISQPIKGTFRRGKDKQEDEQHKNYLRNSTKEQAENIMIVDLVRNDLACCCIPGSIHVEELLGIYSFTQVHQMISTVSGILQPNQPFTEAIKKSFPMGSMTGAPKFKVMQLIDLYEHARRELFSGTIGYITPDGDFDFNVVIRSLFYDSSKNLLTYQTGGAITYDSVPEDEWEEMMLKAIALEKVFNGKVT